MKELYTRCGKRRGFFAEACGRFSKIHKNCQNVAVVFTSLLQIFRQNFALGDYRHMFC